MYQSGSDWWACLFEFFIVCLYVACVHSMSSGGFTSFRLEGPAGSGGVGSVSAVSAQRGNSSFTTAGEGRRRRAGVGQGNTRLVEGGAHLHMYHLTKVDEKTKYT